MCRDLLPFCSYLVYRFRKFETPSTVKDIPLGAIEQKSRAGTLVQFHQSGVRKARLFITESLATGASAYFQAGELQSRMPFACPAGCK